MPYTIEQASRDYETGAKSAQKFIDDLRLTAFESSLRDKIASMVALQREWSAEERGFLDGLEEHLAA